MPVISVKKHLSGDITLPRGVSLATRVRFNRLLRKTAAAARDCRQRWHVNDGYRPYADQVAAYNRYKAGGPLAAIPGTSNHGRGKALDVSAFKGGPPVGASSKRRKALKRYGLCLPVAGEAWHVEEIR
jgi:D-alanyl-D-alanine dipeptidase